MLTKLILLNSLLTPLLNHPLSLGSMLMMQTTMLCISISTLTKNSWFSFIMFITIVGGLMVMFIYMASISANEKFKIKKMLIIVLMLSMIFAMNMNFDEMMFSTNKINHKMTTQENEELINTMKFYNKQKMNLTIMLMMILLLTMISVTQISNSFEGPLKKSYV